MPSRYSYPDTPLLIAGRSHTAADSIPVENPATGEVIGRASCASDAEVDRAISSSVHGFKAWSALPPGQRADIMRAAAGLLRARQDRLAHLLTTEQGKPLPQALEEIDFSAKVIEWCAEEGRRTYGHHYRGASPSLRFETSRQPVGPVAIFIPWNFPAVLLAHKLGGALGAGCSAIVKSAPETPATAVEIVRAFYDAGLPADALSAITGDGERICRRLLGSPAVCKISFTGSTETGRAVAVVAAKHLKRMTLELGGHAPVIVDSMCDAESVARECIRTKIYNAGQVCIAPSRVYVHEARISTFVEAAEDELRKVRVGEGLDPDIDMGPVAHPARCEAMKRFVEQTTAEGGRVIVPRQHGRNRGYFVSPGIAVDIGDDACLMREEAFLPILPVVTFADEEEVLRRANNGPYGLAGYVFSDDKARASRMAAALEVGIVGVNTFDVAAPELPFGGIKDSGFGRECGPDALADYLSTKAISIRQ